MKRLDRGAAAVLLAAGSAALALAIILPPFQFPDEPHHFAAVMIYARGEADREAVERGTIELMDRFQWWQLAGVGRPAELPKRISEIKFLMADSSAEDFRDRIQGYLVYHAALGWAIGRLGIESLAANYYLARSASAAFFLLTILLIWISTSRLTVLWNKDLRWAAYLAAFVPQIAFVGVGVGPDAFVMFLGALFFWAAFELIAGTGKVAHAAVMLLAAGLGLLSDRSSMIFGALVILLPFFAVRRANWEKIIPWTILALVGSILGLYALFLQFPIPLERQYLWLKSVLGRAGPSVKAMAARDEFVGKFWLQFVDTSFLRLGWMHFGPPLAIVWVWRVVWACGIGGLIVGSVDFVRARLKGRSTFEAATRRRLIQFSVAAVLLQGLGSWLYYGSAQILPQGRYLFPLLIPFIALLASGLSRIGELFKARLGRTVVLGLALAEIFIWVYAFWAIAVPVFRLTIRSPYAGV